MLDPAKYLQAQDFPKPREVVISRMAREDLPAREGEAHIGAPMLYVQDKWGSEYSRLLKVPKSLLFGLSLLYGTDSDQWAGKKVTMFSAHCLAFGDREECVRIQFSSEIDAKVRKWFKKRKAPVNAYILAENAQ